MPVVPPYHHNKKIRYTMFKAYIRLNLYYLSDYKYYYYNTQN